MNPPLPAPAPPTCGPPVRDADGGWTVTRHADVTAVLTHPDCEVPVAAAGPPGTLAWLRGAVGRFAARDHHPARRAIGVALLAALDPAELRAAAAHRTRQDRGTGSVAARTGAVARRVPVLVLAERLGLTDPAAAVPAVARVAAAWQPGADPAAVRRADQAVATLVALAPPAPPEVTANRLGLLVQACDATAGLITAAARRATATPAAPTGELLTEMLRLEPPVPATRRIAVAPVTVGGREIGAGEVLLLRFDAANRDPAVLAGPDRFRPGRRDGVLTFGAGPRGCPGERHALALAAGVVDALRGRDTAGTPAAVR
jgi:cytochrome P450